MSREKAPSGDSPVKDPQRYTHSRRVTPNLNLGGEITDEISPWRTLYSHLGYVPPWCRYDPDHPVEFSMGLNILFGKYMVHKEPSLFDHSFQPSPDASRSQTFITATRS
jgi:hypothetical protein